MEMVAIGLLVAMLGWWLWVDIHNRQARKEWRRIEAEQDSAAEADFARRLAEMEQRIRQLQAEVAALKRSAA